MAKIKSDRELERILTGMIRNSPVQAKANKLGDSIIRSVNDDMAGGDVEQIAAELIARLKSKGITPHLDVVHKYAESIADGTFY